MRREAENRKKCHLVLELSVYIWNIATKRDGMTTNKFHTATDTTPTAMRHALREY